MVSTRARPANACLAAPTTYSPKPAAPGVKLLDVFEGPGILGHDNLEPRTQLTPEGPTLAHAGGGPGRLLHSAQALMVRPLPHLRTWSPPCGDWCGGYWAVARRLAPGLLLSSG